MRQSVYAAKGSPARSVQTSLYCETNKDLYLHPEKYTAFPRWIPYTNTAFGEKINFVILACISVSSAIAAAAGVDDSTASQEELLREVFAEQAAICREVIGNPFHPIQLSLEPSSALLQIGQAVYSGSTSAMSLYTALAADGMHQLAEHFRVGTHPKGCWALDMLLGKEQTPSIVSITSPTSPRCQSLRPPSSAAATAGTGTAT
jgi:hypothetical protein